MTREQLAPLGRVSFRRMFGKTGVGKSTLASEYAWRARDQHSVAWRLAAENEDGIIAVDCAFCSRIFDIDL